MQGSSSVAIQGGIEVCMDHRTQAPPAQEVGQLEEEKADNSPVTLPGPLLHRTAQSL